MPALLRRVLKTVTLCCVGSLVACGDSPAGVDDSTFEYTENFAGTPGDEWSVAGIEVAPNGARFLGLATEQEDIILTLSGLPAHQEVTVEFDIHVVGSWNGNSPVDGPDGLSFLLDGTTLLTTTFANHIEFVQNYPDAFPGQTHPRATGATALNQLGYEGDDFTYGNSTYSFTFTRAHTAGTLVLLIDGFTTGEDWGIDNVRITAN